MWKKKIKKENEAEIIICYNDDNMTGQQINNNTFNAETT